MRAVPGVKTACFMNWFGGKNPKDKNEFFASQAADDTCLDVYDEMLVTPAERQAWVDDRRGALIGDVLAKKLGAKVGDTVTLDGHDLSRRLAVHGPRHLHRDPQVDRSFAVSVPLDVSE